MIALDSAALTAPDQRDTAADQIELYKPKKRVPVGAILGIIWLVVLVTLTILATYFPSAVPFIRDYDTRVKVNGRTTSYGLGPGWTAWWGLEKSSYDVFSRCIYGAKATLTIAVGATAIGFVIGGFLGVVAGYFRGWTDRIVSVVADSLLALPALLIAILIVYRTDDLADRYSWLSWANRTWSITLSLGLIAVAPLSRIVRAQTLSLREREFVLASRSVGSSRTRIIVREILPNLIPAMVTLSVTALGALILAEGGLAFLGLGVERPETWGKMIAGAQTDMDKAWWATMFPSLMLFATVFAFNLIGDELARRFDIREAAV
jgi:peptide/nickel transport system permease protein